MDAIDTELLISAVQQNRNIWDISNEEYKNRDCRQKSWEDIAASLIANFEQLSDKEKKDKVAKLQKRWKTVRDAFTRCRAKGKVLKSGSAAKKSSKYVYYENLKFLENTMDLNSTETNFTENDTSQTESQTGDPEEDDDEQLEMDNSEEVERIRTKTRTFERKKSAKHNAVEESLIRFLNKSEAIEIDADKSFLDSLIPTLKTFDEDQKLQFRVQVLNLVMKIKSTTRNSESNPHYYPLNNFQPLSNFRRVEQQSCPSSATTPTPMFSPSESYETSSASSNAPILMQPAEYFPSEKEYEEVSQFPYR